MTNDELHGLVDRAKREGLVTIIDDAQRDWYFTYAKNKNPTPCNFPEFLAAMVVKNRKPK